jgi:hypothetical protein
LCFISRQCQQFRVFNTECVVDVVLYGCEAWSLTLRKERRL